MNGQAFKRIPNFYQKNIIIYIKISAKISKNLAFFSFESIK